MHFLFEVYDPATPAGGPASGTSGAQRARPVAGAAAARVLSNVSCYRGSQRALQTDLVSYDRINSADRKAVTVELEVPANQLPPGLYSCQVNIIDDAAGTFAFPRIPLYVRK
jgi:hypothetical protein